MSGPAHFLLVHAVISAGYFSMAAAAVIVSYAPEAAVAVTFKEAAEETNLIFHHFTGATGELYLPEIMGSGGAMFDYDNDGDLDVYLVQGKLLDASSEMSAARFPLPPGGKLGNRLFRNEFIPDKKLRFTDVTVKAGVGHIGYGMGAAVGDYDSDGDADLYVTNFGPNVLYRNDGNGSFTDVTAAAGVSDPRWSTSAAFVDYDRDRDLDLFVVNYVDFTLKGHKNCYTPAGERDYCNPSMYRPLPSRLFRNEGGGKFVDVTQAAGIGAAFGPGLGVAAADFNADGWEDIYVANDGAANLLWINQGTGTFKEAGLLSGAAYGEDGVARAGMGVAVGDFESDGDEDILVTNLTREGSTLYRNDGRGLFTDATREFGLTQPSLPFTGFGTGWLDYDNDGKLDLFAANGAVALIESLRGTPYPFHQRNQLYRNEGAGKGFREVTAGTTAASSAAGAAVWQLSEVSRGAAFGDIESDGDIDILVTNNNGPARLLINETGAANTHWLGVRLDGVKVNRSGVGAKVAVIRKGLTPLWRRAHTDGSYLSASDHRVHFGLGVNPNIESVIVQWPDGEKEVWSNVRAGAYVTLRQNTGKPWTPPK